MLGQMAPPPKKRRRTGLIVAGAGTAVFALRNTGPFKDSGKAMCEQIRDAQAEGTQVKTAGSTNGGSKWSVDDYHKIRKPFADSRHADLRNASTKFTDLACQLNGMADNSDSALGAALMMGGQMLQAYSSLTGACANHGVDIPNKLGS